ncbi:ecotropic viral integration site 5 ortholog [Xyrauchen texanus]|uniref:ecotropic viral integration site 5 ortholog n=1 Tax=Xyrauchen texanus TaxID=154827 RepID=UPI002241DFA1|nr:ecotropic viral integration site 5 ortholog [Xyrauchen texanus]
MSDKTDQDEEGISGSGVTVVETNRFGFILGNGETDSDGPCPELVRHRETKWLGLIKQWEQVMEKKSNKVKSQCQKGIPASVRAKCWPLLCGAMERREKNAKLYERLVEALDQQGWTDIIKRDTDRQFPFHEMFQSKDGHGQKDLLHVLKAYTQYRPEEGYCQAQGPVAAVLLMNMPAEEAFWCLVQISELYLPGYYSPLLEGVLFDAAVLSSVLKKQCPAVHKHLQNQGVEPLMFATDWLMCLYSRHLPFNTLLRVWDLFFCYGVRVLFQVAVALVRRCLGEARIRKECDGQMETLERLRGVKERVQNVQADTFIHEVCSVPLSLVDLQKQTEKEMEKWKLERPHSTFDPRGRCHGYRMAWERGQEKLRKNEKKEQQKGNLTLPLMRSHSSLSPSILRKKLRKRSSRTETEEWDGGGRNVSQGLMEESDDEEIRRKSVCGVIGEQREKQGRLAHELYTHKQKDHNTHTTIPPQKPKVLVVSYSTESNVFEEGHEDRICASNIQIVTKRDSVKHEDTLHTDTGNCKEETEVSLNQHNDTSATGEGKYDDKERIAASVLEEDIQTHEHHEPNVEKETCQDQNTENKTNQNEQRTKEQTNQDEQNTEKHTCQDEHNVEIRITSESSEESKQTNYYAQVVDVQTTTDKQEEEIQSWGFKRDGAEADTLQKVIIPEDNQQDEENRKNLENITEAEGQTTVFQEDRRSHTSRDQYEEQPIGENYTDVGMEEAGFQHIVVGDGEIPEERKKGKEEERQEAKLEERDNDYHIGDKETLQTSEEHEIEHPNRSVSPLTLADPVQQSQSSDSEHNDMDATERSSDSQHSQIDSKEVEVILRSGNPEQSVEGASGRTDSHETWEDLAVASKNSEDIIMNAASVAMCCNIETSEINTELCERNKTTESENIKCCEMDTSKDSHNLENKREDGTCKSGNSECINFTTGSGNPESDAMESANGSGKPDCKKVDVSTEFHNPKRHQVHVGTGSDNPESDAMDSADGCGNSECTKVHATSESSNNEVQIGSLSGNPESSEVHVGVDCTQVAIGSSNHESNLEHSVVGSGNPECKDEHATSESSNPESSKVFVGSGNPECTQVTIRSGNHESTVVDSAVASGNPECNIVDSADGSGNSLHNSVCAIPDNNQDLETQSKTTSKPSIPNIPPTQHRVGRTSSSRSSYPTILSEDTFRVPKQTHTPKEDITQETHTQLITGSSTKPGAPKCLGLFSRLRGETNKTPVPKIFIQDISEKEEKLTAKERRRRKRESERKEREERKKREKQTEKERKNPQMSGKSFQVLNMECWDNDVSPNNTDSKTLCHRRNSAPFSDSYF